LWCKKNLPDKPSRNKRQVLPAESKEKDTPRRADTMPAEEPTQCSRRNGNKGVDVISANNLKSEKRDTEKSYFRK